MKTLLKWTAALAVAAGLLVLAAALLCKCRKLDPYITLYGSQDPREP